MKVKVIVEYKKRGETCFDTEIVDVDENEFGVTCIEDMKGNEEYCYEVCEKHGELSLDCPMWAVHRYLTKQAREKFGDCVSIETEGPLV